MGNIGTAMAKGQPVVFTCEGMTPSIVCVEGQEKEALELLEKMGVVKIMSRTMIEVANQAYGGQKIQEKIMLGRSNTGCTCCHNNDSWWRDSQIESMGEELEELESFRLQLEEFEHADTEHIDNELEWAIGRLKNKMKEL